MGRAILYASNALLPRDQYMPAWRPPPDHPRTTRCNLSERRSWNTIFSFQEDLVTYILVKQLRCLVDNNICGGNIRIIFTVIYFHFL